jgi:two-component system, NtrC family, response regulator HydG
MEPGAQTRRGDMDRRSTPAQSTADWTPRPVVLLVHEHDGVSQQILDSLAGLPCEAIAVEDRASAVLMLDRQPVEVVVTQLSATRIQGMAILEVARSRNPEAGGILLIRDDEESRATEALARGVVDFLPAPYNLRKLGAAIERILERQRLVGELSRLAQQLDRRFSFPNLIGDSPAVAKVRSWVKEVSPTELQALLIGEEGTGKRLIAGMLHHNSRRRNGPLIELDCSALPPRQIARELFGAPASGKAARRPGRLEMAAEGTLLLHHVTALLPELQERIAELLRTGVLRPTIDGDATEIHPRIIATSEADPADLVEAGRFDAGLLEIVGDARLELLPLRHRRRDIVPLVQHFLAEIARETGQRIRFRRDALDRLVAYDWPGNISELKHTVGGLADQAGRNSLLSSEDLPEDLREAPTGRDSRDLAPGITWVDLERQAIERTLRLCDGNREKAAGLLGIGVRTLYRKLKSYRIG